MAKPVQMPETLESLPFPLHGLNLIREFETQPAGTTVQAVNMRGQDPLELRQRGGSRPGMAKYIDSQVLGVASTIQHLDVVVDPTTEALLSDDDTGAIVDPSTSNLRRRIPVGQTRRLRSGGSGRQPNRNRPRIALTITILDQSKAYGVSYTLDGTQFTTSGLVLGDSISRITMWSQGARAAAPATTYPIGMSKNTAIWSGNKPASGELETKYKVTVVPGTLTVAPSSPIAWVQAIQGGIFGAGVCSAVFASNVTSGNLIVAATCVGAGSMGAVTDTMGNAYTQIGTLTLNNVHLALWYAVSGATGPCTVQFTGAGAPALLNCDEFSNVKATPFDGSSTNSGTTASGTGAATTGSVAVSVAGDLVVGAFASDSFGIGWSSPWSGASGGLIGYVVGLIYQLGLGSATNVPGDLSGAGSHDWCAIGASFKRA